MRRLAIGPIILHVKAWAPFIEEGRLELLRSLEILVSSADSELIDLVEAASVLMGVPTAALTLADSDRQRIKAKVGPESSETASQRALCARAILQMQPLLVTDVTQDPRFRDAVPPTMTSDLRFYIGASIVVDGYAVGTLSGFDNLPHAPSERQVAAFAALTRQAAALFNARLESARLRESEERLERAEKAAQLLAKRFEQLFAGLPVACFTYDSEGRIQEWNAAAEALWGISAAEAFLQPVCGTAVGPDNRDFMGDVVQRVFSGETIHGRERQETMRDGSKKWILSSTIPVRDGTGEILRAVSANVDFTERRWAEQQLADKEERLRTVIDALHEGLVVQNEEGKIILWNASAERTLGLTGDQLCGRTSYDPRWQATHEDGTKLKGPEHPIVKALKTGKAQKTQVVGIRRMDGETRWLKVNAAPIMSGALGRPTAAVASFLDVTERTKQQQTIGEQLRQIKDYSVELESANSKLEALATTDGLTGVRNHRYFQEFLSQKIDLSRSTGIPLTIAFVDVNHFKAYNDDFGHQDGDAVLRRFAMTLAAASREQDLVARYGGEEFVIVMPGLAEGDALDRIEQMRESIAHQSFPHRYVTASFGVASLDVEIRDAAHLIKVADEALYRSKADGRNRVSVWKGGLPSKDLTLR